MDKAWSEQKNKHRNDTETENTTHELGENNINEIDAQKDNILTEMHLKML